jgi:hypothetical protein
MRCQQLVRLRTHINTGHDPDNACSHRLPAHCHVHNTHIDASLDPAIEVDLVEASYFVIALLLEPFPVEFCGVLGHLLLEAAAAAVERRQVSSQERMRMVRLSWRMWCLLCLSVWWWWWWWYVCVCGGGGAFDLQCIRRQ